MRKIVDTMIMSAPVNVKGTAIDPGTFRTALLERYAQGWELYQTHFMGLDRTSGDIQLLFILVKYEGE